MKSTLKNNQNHTLKHTQFRKLIGVAHDRRKAYIMDIFRE